MAKKPSEMGLQDQSEPELGGGPALRAGLLHVWLVHTGSAVRRAALSPLGVLEPMLPVCPELAGAGHRALTHRHRLLRF